MTSKIGIESVIETRIDPKNERRVEQTVERGIDSRDQAQILVGRI